MIDVSDIESWLSDTHSTVSTAHLVLAEVERGLAAAEKVEAVARRSRPLVRRAAVVTVGCLLGVAVGLLVVRARRRATVESAGTDPVGGR